jgi:Raf kinase inhibitor-like YbhB/YbcL family protein
VVDLFALPETGYQFDRWEGDVTDPDSPSTTITMDADKPVTAIFVLIPPFELTSSAFTTGGAIPAQHGQFSVGGSNISPPLTWTGVPAGTQSFVLIMKDPVGWGTPCVHWIIFNIPATTTSMPTGGSSSLPTGALHGIGSDGIIGYYGCEPPAGQLNSYYFTIYALDMMLDLSQGANEQQVINAMDDHVLNQAELVGTYQG